MKIYNEVPLPTGVCLTHDKGYPIVFAYVGGHGRVRMKAKRFNPARFGGIEPALELAAAWREEAVHLHAAEVASLPEPRRRKRAARQYFGTLGST